MVCHLMGHEVDCLLVTAHFRRSSQQIDPGKLIWFLFCVFVPRFNVPHCFLWQRQRKYQGLTENKFLYHSAIKKLSTLDNFSRKPTLQTGLHVPSNPRIAYCVIVGSIFDANQQNKTRLVNLSNCREVITIAKLKPWAPCVIDD